MLSASAPSEQARGYEKIEQLLTSYIFAAFRSSSMDLSMFARKNVYTVVSDSCQGLSINRFLREHDSFDCPKKKQILTLSILLDFFFFQDQFYHIS